MNFPLVLAEQSDHPTMSIVNIGLCVLLMALNFGISWLNAWSVGRGWADAKAGSGFGMFVLWCGGIMAACGFTWTYLIVLALIAGYTGYLPPQYVQGSIELGYVILIVPIIGSGLGITAHSWMAAIRERRFSTGAVAVWNTYAQIHNTVSAVQAMPEVLGHIGKLLGGKGDGKGKFLLLMVLLVILALIGGIFTTIAIVRSSAAAYSGRVSDEIETLRRRRPVPA